MDYRSKYLPEAGQSLRKFDMVPYGSEPEGIFEYACSLWLQQDYYIHLSFAMFSFAVRSSSYLARTPSTVCYALHIRGGVGNGLNLPSSAHNQIQMLSQTRFMLPGHPVIDFRLGSQIPLDAGLASVSTNLFPIFDVAGDSYAAYQFATPVSVLARTEQIIDLKTDCNEVSIEQSLTRPQFGSYYFQYFWADYLRFILY